MHLVTSVLLSKGGDGQGKERRKTILRMIAPWLTEGRDRQCNLSNIDEYVVSFAAQLDVGFLLILSGTFLTTCGLLILIGAHTAWMEY